MTELCLTILLVIANAVAQDPPAAPRPKPGIATPLAPVRSPEVSADGRVTFRLRAPKAKEVSVTGIFSQPLPMQNDEEGVWSATVGPLRPDLYEYAFVVDGLTIPDPFNPRLRPAFARYRGSLVLVPGDIPWSPLSDAPRGAVTRHVFRSSVAGDERDFYVYTPPNYDPKRKQPYPVVYLLHGLWDDARAWIEVGAANVTLDTLIHQGKAAPMVMVNPLGYGTANGPADVDREDMLPNFVRILLEEVMPQVEKRYHVSTRRTERAIAGLSMGGAQAILAGLNHLDKFAWVGSFSGAFNLWPWTRPPQAKPVPMGPPNPDRLRLVASELPKTFPKLDARANAQIRLLWLSCGTADILLRVNREFKAYLDSIGVHAKYTEVPDVGHVWPLWRRNFADFAAALFQ
ncbi:MAG: alpha/beta hydrolase-fold protein [Bryobacterales bacterium]|nr:alpha/beta hydrolase-fold protein [Bryobacteraceae bacterium]MDW8354113.1 alpha/beta hydrolase-fold protein [Bryobacterales bacterium]